mgnify:CR=1 FL=1
MTKPSLPFRRSDLLSPTSDASLALSGFVPPPLLVSVREACRLIGVGNTTSIVWLGILYSAGAIVYVVAYLYRRSQGVSLDAIHAEIPAE